MERIRQIDEDGVLQAVLSLQETGWRVVQLYSQGSRMYVLASC